MTRHVKRSTAWEKLWIQRAHNRSPAATAAYLSNGRWTRTRHLNYLDSIVRDAIIKGGARLIIEWPPRHGKSEFLSHYTPVWYLNAYPDRSVILASNTARLAEKWGRQVRNTIEENPHKLEVRISSDSATRDRWHTSTAGGGMMTAGVGGSILGFGADLFIVDDPHKSQREANSETIRESVWEWWTGTARTRLEPDASVIVLHQRLREDDFIGRLIQQDEDAWQVITMRAIAEDGDPLDRKEGEALWPERYDVEALEALKADIGSHAFESQYQQRPAPPGGAVFRSKHFRSFREQQIGNERYYVLSADGQERKVAASRCWTAQTADTASTIKTTSDWTVVTTWAVTPENDMLLLDVARVRLEVPDQWPFLLAQRARFPGLRWQGVEKKDSGIGLIQMAARNGKPLRQLEPGGSDKITRATPLAVMYENGKVYHLANAPWLACFEAELLSFPHGAHDDQVDPAAYMALEIANSRTTGLVLL